MDVDLVSEAVKFMIIGMGTVFVFLSLMILCMDIMSKIVHKFFPDAPVVTESVSSGETKKNNKVAAIVAAIMHHNQAK